MRVRVCVCARQACMRRVGSQGRLRWAHVGLTGSFDSTGATGPTNYLGQAHWQAGRPPTFSRFPLGYQTWDGRLGSLLVELQRLWGYGARVCDRLTALDPPTSLEKPN